MGGTPHSKVDDFAALGRGRPMICETTRVKTANPIAITPRMTRGT
jgi:hypothetical protein